MNQCSQIVEMDWFFQIASSPSRHCPVTDFIASKGCNHNDGNIGLKFLYSWNNIQSGQTRHPNIGNNQIEKFPDKYSESLGAITHRIYLKSFVSFR